jgi:hypothetical protein
VLLGSFSYVSYHFSQNLEDSDSSEDSYHSQKILFSILLLLLFWFLFERPLITRTRNLRFEFQKIHTDAVKGQDDVFLEK